MKTIGPQTESGPAVVRAGRLTKQREEEIRGNLAVGGPAGHGAVWRSAAEDLLAEVDALLEDLAADREELEWLRAQRMADGDRVLRGEGPHAELGEARGRIAQLEEALASAGRDVSAIREGEDAERAAWQSALDAEREERQAEQQRHAVEQGRRRRTIRALAEELVAEMERGGGV